jgi:DNA-binding NarL/FixJ family response regulator
MPGNNVTILVVDARNHVRTAIVYALASQSEPKLVVTAQNYAEAEEQAAQLCPDIVWLEMNIGQADGIAEIRRLKNLSPNSRILAIADEEEEQEAFAAIMAGAQGYRSLGAIDPGEIASLVQVLTRDEYILHPGLLLHLMRRLRATALGESGKDPGSSAIQFGWEFNKLALLTARERQIFQSIGQGQSESDIAGSLHISQKSVRRHVRSILNKLDL